MNAETLIQAAIAIILDKEFLIVMIHHISIPANQPLHVATVLAEVLHGRVAPFPPNPGSYIVAAGDDYGTMIEVYPDGSEIIPGTADEQASFTLTPSHQWYSAVHAAISVPSSLADLEAIGEREGWRVLHCNRDGLFEVIEFWVENRLMLELLPPAIASIYLNAMTAQNLDYLMAELEKVPAHV